MSTQNGLTQHKASSERSRIKVDIPVLRLNLVMNSRMVRSTLIPGGKKTAAQLQFRATNPSVTCLTIKTQLHSTHGTRSLLMSRHKTVDFLSPRTLVCAWPGSGLAWRGPGQLQKSVSSPLSPPLLSVLSGCHSSSSSPLHRPLYAALKAAHVQTLLGKAP